MTEDRPFPVYFAARVRGQKSRLFHRAQYDEMLEAAEIQTTIDKLLASTYSEDMADALSRMEGADAVEDAVSRNLVRTYQRLFRNISDPEYRKLAEIFVARWDLAAVKTLLRCRHQGIDLSEAPQQLIPGPTLTVALQQDLAALTSMAELIGGLVRWNSDLCAPLQRRLAEYEESNSLAVLEEALDRAYFATNAQNLRYDTSDDVQMLRRILQLEIDRINLRILLTMRHHEGNLMERVLPHGTLAASTLQRMAEASDAEAAVAALGATSYSDLAEGVYEFVQAGRFSQMERLFDRHIINEIRKYARVHVFSIAVFMEYVWMKYNEVVNMRLVARGEARGLPKQRIREEMIYV